MLFWEHLKDDALVLYDFSNHDFVIGGFMQSALYLKLYFKCADNQTKEMRDSFMFLMSKKLFNSFNSCHQWVLAL